MHESGPEDLAQTIRPPLQQRSRFLTLRTSAGQSCWRCGGASVRDGTSRGVELETPPAAVAKRDELQPEKVSVHVQDPGEILKTENAQLLRTQPIGNLLTRES